MGKTHTKEFTEEKERPVFLITDQSSSMFFGSVLYLKSVCAAQIAALSCWRVIDVGDRVGGIVFNDDQLSYISPKRDRKSVQQYLALIAEKNRKLVSHKTDQGDNNALNNALQHANEQISHDYLVIVISDFYNFDIVTLKNLTRLRRNNDVIAIHILDPAEKKLPEGKIILTDGEFQTQLSEGKKIKNQYHTKKEKDLEQIQSNCKKYNIPFVQLHTAEEPSKQLRALFKTQIVVNN